jgi:hypothetical protein
MASPLSATYTLCGGCFCNAISYTISVPSLSSRPLIPTAPKYPIGPQNDVTERLPLISLDHCTSCRRVSGAIVQGWFICPQAWVEFSLEPRSENNQTDQGPSADRIKPPSTFDFAKPGKELLENSYLSYFSSSKDVHRTFCGRCGTHLTYYCSEEDNKMVEKWGLYFDIHLGTLEKEGLARLRPCRHEWWDDGIGWIQKLLTDGEASFYGTDN